jgi:ABC-type uncharacterized transport system auxiliary subunit
MRKLASLFIVMSFSLIMVGCGGEAPPATPPKGAIPPSTKPDLVQKDKSSMSKGGAGSKALAVDELPPRP